MECQFCKNTFSNKKNLNAHQKNAKYCLKIQGKDPNYIYSCHEMARNKKNTPNGTPRPRTIPALNELTESDDDQPLKRHKTVTVDLTDEKASKNEVMPVLEKMENDDDFYQGFLFVQSFAHSLLENSIRFHWRPCAEEIKKKFEPKREYKSFWKTCLNKKSCLRLTKDKAKEVIQALAAQDMQSASYVEHVNLIKLRIAKCIQMRMINCTCSHCKYNAYCMDGGGV
jgi:hypothetical protein